MAEMRQITLSEDLCSAVEHKFKDRFQSVQELLEFILRDLLQDAATRLDQNEQRILEERLRELGYI